MEFIVWNDKLSVGNEALDRDHRQMVAYINELYDAILAGHGKKVVVGMGDRLERTMRAHFAREEKLFTESDYPDAALHKHAHDAMRGWVSNIRARIADGTAVAPALEMMNQLKDWLFDHQISADQKYVPYLAQSGKQGRGKTAAKKTPQKRAQVAA